MTLRRSTMRPSPPVDHRSEPGYAEWKKPVYGRCACCGEGDGQGGEQRLERHHVVHEQHVRREGGDPWDLRNSLCLGMWCRCHKDHTVAARRLSRSILPAAAVEFAEELLGKEPAELYLERYYRP